MKKLALILGVLSLVACTDQTVVNYNTARLDNIETYLANNKAVKPSENLEKLDFYERVVRSVAREEAEVAGYYEIMNDEPKAVETTEAPVAEEVAPVVEPVQQ